MPIHRPLSNRRYKPVSNKPRPALIFTGLRMATVGRGVRVAPDACSSSLVSALYYNDNSRRGYADYDYLIIVPSRADDKLTGQIIGKSRNFKGDRVVWHPPNPQQMDVVIYTTLITDIENTAKKFLTDSVIAYLAAGKNENKTALDSLVPFEETLETFVNGILELYERACTAKNCNCANFCNHSPIVTIDDIEGDYRVIQKLLAYVERGSTPGERESALRKLTTRLNRLHERCENA